MGHHIMDGEHVRARILRAARILGGVDDAICRHCDEAVGLDTPHAPSCLLRNVNPESLRDLMMETSAKAKREVNRQRIFKTDKKYWNGLPSPPAGGKTLVKRGPRGKREPGRTVKWCRVCYEDRLYISGKCRVCEHVRPCAYDPLAKKNCTLCHPEGQAPSRKKQR